MSEPHPAGSSRDFLSGIGAGIAAATIAAQLWLAVYLAPLQGIFRHFRADVPWTADLAAHAGWRWGVPLAGALLLAGSLLLRPRRALLFAGLAAVLLVLLILTYTWAMAPLTAVSDSIRSDP
ncbi:MAG: hypothetical protein HY905_18595 [Deltaproteobacteria bacterium]|nr:hypothetical protein [Deltaproteobacteria bacterium]